MWQDSEIVLVCMVRVVSRLGAAVRGMILMWMMHMRYSIAAVPVPAKVDSAVQRRRRGFERSDAVVAVRVIVQASSMDGIGGGRGYYLEWLRRRHAHER
jgi:hypothetical protein